MVMHTACCISEHCTRFNHSFSTLILQRASVTRTCGTLSIASRRIMQAAAFSPQAISCTCSTACPYIQETVLDRSPISLGDACANVGALPQHNTHNLSTSICSALSAAIASCLIAAAAKNRR